MADEKGYTNYATQGDDYGNHPETSVATNPSAPPSSPPSGAPPAYYAAPGTAPQQYQPPGGNFNTSYQPPPPQHMTTSAPCTMYTGEQQMNYSVQQAPAQQTIIVRQPQFPFQDHTNSALVVTFCCCLPFGIIGLLKMSEAKNLHATGNYEAATLTAASAGKWTKAGLITGIVTYCLIVTFFVLWILIVTLIST